MDYQTYTQRAQQAAQLVETGAYEQAHELLRQLVASDISERDKAIMCLNLAIVADKLGQTTEALRWYDEGMAYESRHGQVFVAESKAIYLAEQGKAEESLALYETLLTRASLDGSTQERIRQNIRRLRQRVKR